LGQVGCIQAGGGPARIGFGLLSALSAATEISILSRSARGGAAIQWRADARGRIEQRERDEEAIPVGTTIHLVARAEREALFEVDRLRDALRTFGCALEIPLYLRTADGRERINRLEASWHREQLEPERWREEAMAFGESLFGQEFLECLPLRSPDGSVRGIGYIPAQSPPPYQAPEHRIFQDGIYVGSAAPGLVPSWAFFVHCAVEVRDPRPRASRDGLLPGPELDAAEEAIRRSIEEHLLWLDHHDPRRLEALIGLHYQALKAAAIHDSYLLSLVLDFLPFETTLGLRCFRDIKALGPIHYTQNAGAYHQLAPIAAAQGLCVINAGYTHDAELLEQARAVIPGLVIAALEPVDVTDALRVVPRAQAPGAEQLMIEADAALGPYGCVTELRAFAPDEVAGLYVPSDDGNFLRALEQANGDAASANLGLVMIPEPASAEPSRLYLNHRNPLIRHLIEMEDPGARDDALRLVYVHALLFGHHPLSERERALLDICLLDLLRWGVSGAALSVQ
ncbi:MAG: hypothetical protein OEY14_16395, partial [Myxococcales bacterium]|nr:hypothetical protein [Myxococcales bacterium]